VQKDHVFSFQLIFGAEGSCPCLFSGSRVKQDHVLVFSAIWGAEGSCPCMYFNLLEVQQNRVLVFSADLGYKKGRAYTVKKKYEIP